MDKKVLKKLFTRLDKVWSSKGKLDDAYDNVLSGIEDLLAEIGDAMTHGDKNDEPTLR